MKSRYIGRIIKVDTGAGYALAVSDELNGTIYISLGVSWLATIEPHEKMVVVLEDVYRADKGWRAKTARPYIPEDDRQQEMTNTEINGVLT